MYICTHVYVCIYTCMYIHTYIYIYIYIHVSICVYIYIYILYYCTRISLSLYIYIYIYMCSPLLLKHVGEVGGPAEGGSDGRVSLPVRRRTEGRRSGANRSMARCRDSCE